MKMADNGKYGPLIRNFLKRGTMFNDRIQIRVAIDLKLLADKAQAISSKANDTTSNCHGEIRYSPAIVSIEALSNGAQ